MLNDINLFYSRWPYFTTISNENYFEEQTEQFVSTLNLTSSVGNLTTDS